MFDEVLVQGWQLFQVGYCDVFVYLVDVGVDWFYFDVLCVQWCDEVCIGGVVVGVFFWWCVGECIQNFVGYLVQCVFWGVEWFVVVVLVECVVQYMVVEQCGDFLFQYWCVLVWVVVQVELYLQFVGDYVVGFGIGMDVGDLQVGWWEVFIVVVLLVCCQFGYCCGSQMDWIVCFLGVCYMILYVFDCQCG